MTERAMDVVVNNSKNIFDMVLTVQISIVGMPIEAVHLWNEDRAWYT